MLTQADNITIITDEPQAIRCINSQIFQNGLKDQRT
jgi:hypothetical protein